MKSDYKFNAYDKKGKFLIKISSLNFDDTGLVQLSGFTSSGKLIHIPITDVRLTITSDTIEKNNTRLDEGRHYLMGVEPGKLTVEDCLEAFGFSRNGLSG
jgi:hypothetical protein